MVYKVPQDIFRKIIGDISKKYSISNILGYNILFYLSTKKEFISVVGMSEGKKLPFFYVNSSGMYIEDNILTIPEIIIATKSLGSWTSEDRDRESFKPYLIPILREFMSNMKINPNLSIYKEGKVHYHYLYGSKTNNGYDGHEFTENIDAIELSDFKFRMSYKCFK